jgi:hypothetical protein
MRTFPGNKGFAFSIFDDTDWSTVENTAPVYRLLCEIGVRTTKSVWPLAAVNGAAIGGSTLQDPEYLSFIHTLQAERFEIGLHNVRNHDSTRETVQQGIDEFHRFLGQYPIVHANHYLNRENMYWGPSRLIKPATKLGYQVLVRLKQLTRLKQQETFEGHVEASRYFWGDICKEHIRFVRNFVFSEVNLANINPSMPYHDPARPFVNFWFSSCEGGTIDSFCKTLSEENQDRLEAEGGICIMYTHFGAGFCDGGTLNPRFESLMRRIARKPGWFVPVSELLEFLRKGRNECIIDQRELSALEWKWLSYKLQKGRS